MEGVDWVYNIAESSWQAQNVFDKIVEEVKEIKETISTIDIKKLEETKLRLFNKFIKSLT